MNSSTRLTPDDELLIFLKGEISVPLSALNEKITSASELVSQTRQVHLSQLPPLAIFQRIMYFSTPPTHHWSEPACRLTQTMSLLIRMIKPRQLYNINWGSGTADIN